jgi:hypothetical protein
MLRRADAPHAKIHNLKSSGERQVKAGFFSNAALCKPVNRVKSRMPGESESAGKIASALDRRLDEPNLSINDRTELARACATDKAEAYYAYLLRTGLADYRQMPGNLGVYVFRRKEGEITHTS